MKKLFVLIICLLTLSSISQAQNYDRAIGIRFGYPTGMTYKQFVGSNSALEFIVGGGQNGGNLTVLYELHSEALDYSLNIVYGLGGHIGIWRENLNVGADGIFGLEFAPDSPIVFAIDIKPTLYLWRGNIRNSTGGAFSVRYAF
ncbi:MAG: hypothetical protein ACPG49_02655 [Chitinophagales bacterium]